MLLLFGFGCIVGSIAGLCRIEVLFNGFSLNRWLNGESLPFGQLLLLTIRVPALLYLCASARIGKKLSPVVFMLQGAFLSCVLTDAMLRNGLFGLLLSLQSVLFSRLVLLPLLFGLALRCETLRQPIPLSGRTVLDLLLLLTICAVCAGADWLVTPRILHFLLWIRGE